MNSPVIAAERERRVAYTRPASPPRNFMQPSISPESARLNVTVLLVDDDIPTRRTMAYLLKRCTGLHPLLRVRCIEVSTGAEALSVAIDPDVQFAFLDYHMPDMTGLDLLGELLRRRPALPITMLTGDDHRTLAIEAIKRGAYDVILKTDATQDLLNHSLWKGLVWAELQEKLLAQTAQLTQMELCVNLT